MVSESTRRPLLWYSLTSKAWTIRIAHQNGAGAMAMVVCGCGC